MKNSRRIVFAPVVFVSVIAAVIAIVPKVSRASIPASNGVITACILPSRQVRIIDTAVTPGCMVGEIMVTWNQRGPTGPTGPVGPQGRWDYQGLRESKGLLVQQGHKGHKGRLDSRGRPGCPPRRS